MKVFLDASLLIYLNIPLKEAEAKLIESFYRSLLDEELYTDVLVLDEVIYVSERKYKVKVGETLEFIDRAVLPYVEVLPLTLEEYLRAKKHILEYGLPPSDALHLAVMDSNGIGVIATEDADFDKTHVKRLWIGKGWRGGS